MPDFKTLLEQDAFVNPRPWWAVVTITQHLPRELRVGAIRMHREDAEAILETYYEPQKSKSCVVPVELEIRHMKFPKFKLPSRLADPVPHGSVGHDHLDCM